MYEVLHMPPLTDLFDLKWNNFGMGYSEKRLIPLNFTTSRRSMSLNLVMPHKSTHGLLLNSHLSVLYINQTPWLELWRPGGWRQRLGTGRSETLENKAFTLYFGLNASYSITRHGVKGKGLFDTCKGKKNKDKMSHRWPAASGSSRTMRYV